MISRGFGEAERGRKWELGTRNEELGMRNEE